MVNSEICYVEPSIVAGNVDDIVPEFCPDGCGKLLVGSDLSVNYSQEFKINEGAFSEVYDGFWLGKPVAVKISCKNKLRQRDKAYEEAVKREVDLFRTCIPEDPNII